MELFLSVEPHWGSVLKNPDRLQVAQKILFNMVFWAT
ncbi:Hypothetical protein DIP0039 [Corynebacterium diphtheriae]|uniref:Uncharacterized protein n=1 Tax=Corynebacterium diphtheriae (strain ATCC 700971 / NCTC 13129 / Biotype gravis) TaxID=257309 RepID=Q6NKI0_CORDI|nr:Hypothetical protein DIP0039 [Corynebacterium diphtheriae]